MDDLGDEKAGDGGAINQLPRQVGGALGVAVVGTVFAGSYASQVEEALGALPPGHRERASHSIEEARDVLAHLPNGLRDVLTMRVDDAFDSAAHLGFGVCAGVMGLAAVAALPTILFNQTSANFYFGGTSILIVVGVALDTMKQLEAQLMMRNYEGFLK